MHKHIIRLFEARQPCTRACMRVCGCVRPRRLNVDATFSPDLTPSPLPDVAEGAGPELGTTDHFASLIKTFCLFRVINSSLLSSPAGLAVAVCFNTSSHLPRAVTSLTTSASSSSNLDIRVLVVADQHKHPIKSNKQKHAADDEVII